MVKKLIYTTEVFSMGSSLD